MPSVPALLDDAARRWRIPTVLLRALAWHESRWQQSHRTPERVGVLGVAIAGRSDTARLAADGAYNIEQGARQLYLCWNRAPILGNGRLEDGRNILECWFYALGRYGTGKEGAAGHVYANKVLDALASGGEGRFEPVAVTRPSVEKLAWGRSAPTGPPAPWHFGDVAPLPPAVPVVNLKLPYVMQVWDSPDSFNGDGSCGPCSMIMLLAGLGKRAPKPVAVAASYPHVSAWGGYIQEIDDAVCEPNSGAVHAKMLAYLRPDFPTAAIVYNEKATFARVKAELDAGRPVILGTRVTPAGHLMTARGYLSDGKRIIVNDPAGNQTLTARRNSPDGPLSPTGNRYWNGGGEGAIYEWDALDVRWLLTVGPRPTDADSPEDDASSAPSRPKDAVVLIGETGYALVPEKDAPTRWVFHQGVLTAPTGWESLVTKDAYRDFRLHIEFNVNAVPGVTDPEKDGNSGVYLQQRYEIQILNSFAVTEKDYKASYGGSIYQLKKPDRLVNKKAGEWQSYDIVFRAARFVGGRKTENARVTVYQNQQLIHDDVAIPRKTGAGLPEGPEPRPILLQGHNNPVRFRNFWVQKLTLGD